MSDDVLREVADLLFGGGADQLVSKMNPAQSDLATAKKDRRVRAQTAGLGAVGAAAGVGGFALAGREMHSGYKAAKKIGAAKPLRTALKSRKFATALLPLEAVGLGGEIMSTKILHNDATKPSPKLKPIKKSMEDKIPSVPTKRSVALAAARDPRVARQREKYLKNPGLLRKLTAQAQSVEKSAEVEVVWDAEIAKADVDKQQVFGWASVVNVNGEPVVDLQGDYISPDEMEKAAYTYVMKSRKGGDMHQRDGLEPIQKSAMIESFIVTDEKKQAMGLPDSVNTGWWVGFQVQDPDLWADVKSGKRTGFSIHGHGRRAPA